MKAQRVMCPHCGSLHKPRSLIPFHAYGGRTCPGVGQIPRCAESDRRPLWNGAPNPHADRAVFSSSTRSEK